MRFTAISVGRILNQTYGTWAPVPLVHWEPTEEQYLNAEALMANSSINRPVLVAWSDISRSGPTVWGVGSQGAYPALETNADTPAYRIGDRSGGARNISFSSPTWNSNYDVTRPW